ncbi:MAG: hypothetical protein EOL86_11385 [Deltaproteobacteria bacterium]|nr:hypothetical protein [Deltaproteobacteria bacterium]
MDLLKIGMLVFCLVVVCIVLALGQRSKAKDVFHLMRMVLWMLFMFVGNSVLPDMAVLAHDDRLRIGVMLVWLALSYGLSWGCVRFLRQGARV